MEGYDGMLLDDSFEQLSDISRWDLVESEPTSQIGLEADATVEVPAPSTSHQHKKALEHPPILARFPSPFGKAPMASRDMQCAHFRHSLQVNHSSQKTEHMTRSLNQFAGNTLVKYCGALIHWFSVCISSRVDPWSISEVGLSDLLCIHKLARQSNGQGPKVSMTLKALRWAVNHMKIECLNSVVYGGIVSSFDKQRAISDRRETLPFSL